METKLTNEACEEIFHTALCDGLESLAISCLFLDFSRSAYATAAAQSQSQCHEDVLMQMLKNGQALRLMDEGDEDAEFLAAIKLNDIYERMPKVDPQDLAAIQSGNYDSVTADNILQTIFLGSVQYC